MIREDAGFVSRRALAWGAGIMIAIGAAACALRTLSNSESLGLLRSEASASPGNGGEEKEKSAPAAAPARFLESIDADTFLRGNLHTHSLFSDGDSPPREVYAFYRDHGYAFLALTDHNRRTDPTEFRSEQRPGFVMIPGEEVTTQAAGKPVHVNAICSKTTIGGGTFATAREALAWAVARVKEQDAIALVNHPNFDWTLTAEDLPAAHGADLIEIWSGHPYVNSEGDLLRPSHEALWAKMLDQGESFAGVALDDMHVLTASTREPSAKPLRAWVEVFGAQATESAICDALRRGRLYASAGPKLARLAVKDDTIAVTVAEAASVEFVGAEGAVLAKVDAAANQEARYQLRGGERYVRARITDGNGKRAWTQAYRVAK